MKNVATFKTIALFMMLCFFTKVKAQQNVNLINAGLAAEREKYGLTSDDIKDYFISDQYTDENTGFSYNYIQQRHNNIIVYNAVGVCLIKNNAVVYTRPVMIDNLAKKIKTDKPSITAEAAIGYALIQLGRTSIAPVKLTKTDAGLNKYTYESSAISNSPITVQLVYRAMDEGVFLAWDVSIEMINEPHWWNIRVDALTGNYLDKNDWTTSCTFEHGNMEAHINESGFPSAPPLPLPLPAVPAQYQVYALPLEAPSFGSRSVLANPSDNTASPYGWHDDNGATGAEYTITRGNNVYAYEDANNDNQPGYSPNNASLIFNYPIDLTQAPLVNQDASLTNLFYVCNRIHDVLYPMGFTEAAGNFQANNYGNGGLGNDYVKAEGFDGSGTSNANFSTPNDGASGRMQMYLFTAPTPDRDGSLDNGIVTHEYGHGVSNRLTGGPSNSGCLTNAEHGGEGWSDWLALILTTEPGDTANGGMLTQSRGIGTYALNQATTGPGIRRFPYSVNMAINPQTYANVAASTEIHNVGEIWCDAIWDMSCFLINDFGFNSDPTVATAGNNIAMRLVLEGMKLQPCSPGFLDARDAILLADAILYDNAHRCRIWEAFARRGMGVNAIQGSSNSATDQTAGFALPSYCLPITQAPVAAFTSNVNTISCGGSVQFTDASVQPLSWLWKFGDGTTSTMQNPSHQFISSGSFNVKLVVANTLGSDSVTYVITVAASFTASVTATPNPVACGSPVQLNATASGSNYITYKVSKINYAPLSGTITPVSLADDVMSSALPIGFTFNFFGQNYTNFYICSNGYITFSAGQPASPVYGVTLPLASTPNNLIALAWNDLNPSNAGSSVGYFLTGVAPNRKLVIQYTTSHYGGVSYPFVVQGILTEGSDRIEIHTTTISDASGFDPSATTTQGVENASGTIAVVVAGRNGAVFAASNDAYRFIPIVNYTYKWKPGNLNGAAQTVTPVANTTYTVSVGDGSGCIVPVTSPLVVVTGATPVITGNTPLCGGGFITLNAGSFATYLWSTGSTTQTINVANAGTYTVTVTTASGCTGSASVTTSSLTPPVISGNLTPCIGTSTTLSTGVYSSYLWSTGATTQAITVSANANYKVTVSNGSGCTVSSSAKVKKKALPVITATPTDANLCPPSTSIALSVSGNATTYTWSPATGLNKTTGSAVTASPVVTTTYIVTGSNAAGCTATKSAKIAVMPKPSNLTTTNITATSAKTNWSLVDCATGYVVQYKAAGGSWVSTTINTNTPTKTLTGLTASTNYSWRVKSKFSDGTFSSYTNPVNFSTPALRIGEAATANSLQVYPNPATDKLTLEFPFIAGDATIDVVNAIGQSVLKQTVTNVEGVLIINIQNLPEGLYMVTLKNEDNTFNSRFVKK